MRTQIRCVHSKAGETVEWAWCFGSLLLQQAAKVWLAFSPPSHRAAWTAPMSLPTQNAWSHCLHACTTLKIAAWQGPVPRLLPSITLSRSLAPSLTLSGAPRRQGAYSTAMDAELPVLQAGQGQSSGEASSRRGSSGTLETLHAEALQAHLKHVMKALQEVWHLEYLMQAHPKYVMQALMAWHLTF